MTIGHRAPPKSGPSEDRRVRPRRGYAEWFLGVVGAISAFLGSFILFADVDQYVGVGGSVSWRVGDIAPVWGYGLLAVGVVLLGAVVVLAARPTGRPRPELSTPRTELAWHTALFLVVNAVLWAQDLIIGGGLDYAYWVTIPWGVGLVIHIVATFSDRSTIQDPSIGGER